MTSLVAGPASRCAGAGNRVGRDRTSGRAESNGMCGRRSRGRPPEFPNIKERLLAVASDLFYRCGVRAVSVDEIVKAAGVPPNRYYPSSFLPSIFCTKMKNKRALEINRRANFRASSEKFNFTKHLVGFWRDLERDLEDKLHWKYDELSPLPLLEKLKLAECPADKDELARAEFFWSRRPRLLPAAGYIVWLIVALGLPFWLFTVPAIGLPLLIISAVVVNTGIVQSVRWRRQYELSINRLIRHFGRSEHSKPSV